jgi:hypothetical protein
MAPYGMLCHPMPCLMACSGLAMEFRSLTPSRHIPVELLNITQPRLELPLDHSIVALVVFPLISCYLWVSFPPSKPLILSRLFKLPLPPLLDAPTIHYLATLHISTLHYPQRRTVSSRLSLLYLSPLIEALHFCPSFFFEPPLPLPLHSPPPPQSLPPLPPPHVPHRRYPLGSINTLIFRIFAILFCGTNLLPLLGLPAWSNYSFLSSHSPYQLT